MANDGGPAFPFTPNQQMKLPDGTWDQDTEFGDPGMSKREFYAGLAMLGTLTNARLLDATYKAGEAKGMDPGESIVVAAFNYADAMLAEAKNREQEKPDDTKPE